MKKPFKSLRGFIPLVYLGEYLVLSFRDHIYISDLSLHNPIYVCSLNSFSYFKNFLCKFRLIERSLRLQMGPAVPLLDNHTFLVCFSGQVFCIDIDTGNVCLEELPPSFPRRPLQMLMMQSMGYEGIVLCGDYSRNSNFETVNVYMRDISGNWSIAFSFPPGEVNHIHGIFEDTINNCLYILTGDFGQAACIWISNFDFSDVRPFFRDGQKSRSCWLVPSGDRLYFATDQQYSVNSFCSLQFSGDTLFHEHFPIVGSSIYFSFAHTDPIIFSTAVEPMPSNYLTLGSLVSSRRAPGILSASACIYSGSIEKGFSIIFKAEKDLFPFVLCQLGSIQFPAGSSSRNDYIHFYCTALRGYDGNTYVMDIG